MKIKFTKDECVKLVDESNDEIIKDLLSDGWASESLEVKEEVAQPKRRGRPAKVD